MVDDADSYAVSRRHHLTTLAYEVGVRGLQSRLVGPGGDILWIADSSAGRDTMVVATPSSDGGWSYLWGGGGSVATADPSRAANLIAAYLAR
jgi:hypothetical protein